MQKYNIVLEETWLDYPDPKSNAIIVYMTGCEHHCKGCHSPSLQVKAEYTETKEEIVKKVEDLCKRADTNKIVLLGGDPLFCTNLEITKYILKELANDYDICIFTGYDIEKIKELNIKGAKYYKCGKYIEELKRESKKTDDEYILASPNQNFYDSNYNQLSVNGVLKFKIKE